MDRMPPPPRPAAGSKGNPLLKHALTQGFKGPPAVVPEEPNDSESPATDAQDDVELPVWQDYWSNKVSVELPGRGSFNVYLAGSEGALVLCLHGAGYTGLTWSLVAVHLRDKYKVAAPDLRRHGLTTTLEERELSREVMVDDIVDLVKALVASPSFSAAAAGGAVPVVLVGHSMGGGLAVWAAAALQQAAAAEQLPVKVEGVVVIDVVEGTAIAALPHMVTILDSRPTHFPSLPAALHWARRSGTSKDAQAAAISMPAQLVETPGGSWTWRTPLHDTQPHWEGWYRGLSEEFLSLRCPKMLVLAGTDRLDRTLTIGQMQGKFQLVLLPTAGHAVHEDQHGSLASKLTDFLKRFRIGQPALAIPRAPAGTRPVLPVVAGPAL